MHAYLMGILCLGLLLCFERAFCVPSPTALVHAEPQPLRSRMDAIAYEIRRYDESKTTSLRSSHRRSSGRPLRLVAYSEPPASKIDLAIEQIRTSITKLQVGPTFGTLNFDKPWRAHVSNAYSVGILANRVLTDTTSLELETSLGRSFVSYGGAGHQVDQLGAAGALRLNLLDNSPVTPYVSAGIGLNYFSGLTHGASYAHLGTYNDWLMSAQLAAGIDVPVTARVRIGVRGTYLSPLFHRPYTSHTRSGASPYFEDAALLNTGFYRAMGLVSVAL